MHHQHYLYNYPSIKFLYHRCPIRIHLHLNDAEKHLPYRSKLILEKIFKIFDIAENRVLAPSKWSDRVVSSKFGISRPENISIHLKNSCLHEWQHFKNEKNNKKTTIWFHFWSDTWLLAYATVAFIWALARACVTSRCGDLVWQRWRIII